MKSVLLHEIQNRTPVISELIASRAGKGLEFETLCKLMACSKEFNTNSFLQPMYAQHQEIFLEFFANRKTACEEVTSQPSLTLCFDKMIEYKETPFFLDVMKAMQETSAARIEDEPFAARQQMARTHALLETYDWNKFCAQLEVYQDFHVILQVFMDNIVDVVTNEVHRWSYCDEGASGGVTAYEYHFQKHRILGNMGDAGVVECIWTVCRYHSTCMPTQQKLIKILCEMARTRSVSAVRNILKIPGHMHILHDISSFDDFTQVFLYPFWQSNCNLCNCDLGTLIMVMFPQDPLITVPLFTAHEELQVVNMVHNMIATRDFTAYTLLSTLIPLLIIVCEYVRPSTVRELTDAQIHALLHNSAIQANPKAMQLVSTLLYRSYAAKDIVDTSEIPDLLSSAR